MTIINEHFENHVLIIKNSPANEVSLTLEIKSTINRSRIEKEFITWSELNMNFFYKHVQQKANIRGDIQKF